MNSFRLLCFKSVETTTPIEVKIQISTSQMTSGNVQWEGIRSDTVDRKNVAFIS